MPVSDKDMLVEALRRGDFEAVLGTPESEWVDFKSEVYPLDTPKGPREYAKDVAALANAGGGLIVIGYKTAKAETDLESRAQEHRPVPKDLVDPKKLADILVNTVYPAVRGINTEWFPDNQDPKGVLVVTIPAQRQQDKPFIVRKFVGDDARDFQAFGIPLRSGAHTSWVHTESMHAALVQAELVRTLVSAVLTAGELPSVFRSLASGVVGVAATFRPTLFETALPEAVTPSNSYAAEVALGLDRRADERIASIRREMEWQDLPSYFLQAFPPTGDRRLTKVHSKTGVRGAFANPPVLRPLGWHLASGLEPEVREGGLVLIEGTRSIIWLERDGVFTAGALATPEFLGWAMNKSRENGPGPYTLNSLSLVEYTLEFFRFVHTVLVPHAPAGAWKYRVVTRGFKTASGGVQLSGGFPEEWKIARHASGDDLDETIPGTREPGRDALNALESVYGLFGLGVDDIPFQEGGAISEAAIIGRR